MTFSGYSNPMRSFERKLAPDAASREFRDPGLKTSGLGSLHHTMPHLRRMTATRLQGGGSLDPVGEVYASSRPNLYNPDPQYRRVLDALRQIRPTNPDLRALPGSTVPFSYAEGGGAPADMDDAMAPEGQGSAGDDQMRQVVLEALAALEGQSPDPEEALAHFIDTFGPRALADLQQLAEQKHRQEQEGDDNESEDQEEPAEPAEQPDEEDDLAAAGGGLLAGPGTGQSDEIEAATPSGRPVLLSDGEYVIDAPTVAALGDGSTSAGARRLDQLRKQIRRDAYGSDKQAKPMRKGGGTLTLRLK